MVDTRIAIEAIEPLLEQLKNTGLLASVTFDDILDITVVQVMGETFNMTFETIEDACTFIKYYTLVKVHRDNPIVRGIEFGLKENDKTSG